MAAVCAAIAWPWIVGCGTPGAPLPPSLRLPEPVSTLTAARSGASVTLAWTNPQKTTDGVEITAYQTEIEADLCRAEAVSPGVAADCVPVRKLSVKPGSETTILDPLPAALTTGSARALRYWVVLRNRRGRTAGVSNVAVSVAGQAPNPIVGLTAAASADGVVLRWQADGSVTPVRLHRHLLRSAQKPKGAEKGAAQPELADQDLMVDAPASTGTAGAVDRDARSDEEYRYTAQRVVTLDQAMLGSDAGQRSAAVQQPSAKPPSRKPHSSASRLHRGSAPANARVEQAVTLAGDASVPVTVSTRDVFPPAIPQGLEAAYTLATHTVDLSWTPDMEPDLAGYFVERSTDGGAWTRISSARPLEVPAYSDTAAEPGHAYRYRVSAVDTHGNQSRPSTAVPVDAGQTP